MGCCNHFEFPDQGDSFESWQGLRGPKGYPGPVGPAGPPGAAGQPGPAGPAGPQGEQGPPGTSVELKGPVASTSQLPTSAPSGELWLVGTASPYDGWFYNGSSWQNAGQVLFGPQGPAGADGTTFTPSVSSEGVISWTNDGGKQNPPSVNIKGPQGPQGETGATGATGATGPAGQNGSDGADGTTFTPAVSSEGVISWTNDGGKQNPSPVNIKGPQGETGATGATGPAGPGVPPGGTAGQVLTKTGSADYATGWADPPGVETEISISLSASWSGSGPYTQTVMVAGGTANSKISLQPDDSISMQLISDGVQVLRIDNNNGSFVAHAIGAAPSTALSIQATRREVTT